MCIYIHIHTNTYTHIYIYTYMFPRECSGKESTYNAEDLRDRGSIPGLGKGPEGGHDNPLHYSCLENPMDRGAWWATVHRVTNSWTRLKWPSTQTFSEMDEFNGFIKRKYNLGGWRKKQEKKKKKPSKIRACPSTWVLSCLIRLYCRNGISEQIRNCFTSQKEREFPVMVLWEKPRNRGNSFTVMRGTLRKLGWQEI